MPKDVTNLSADDRALFNAAIDPWAASRGIRSGVASCVRADTAADDAEWSAYTGTQTTYVHAFANAATWGQVVSAIKAAIAAFPSRKLAWAFPLATGTNGNAGGAPTQDTTPAQVAAGTYDSYINYCLDMMIAHNPEGMIPLRLGWEAANYSPWPWSATWNNATAVDDYIAAFQHVSAMAKAKSPNFKVIWCQAHESFNYNGALVDPTTICYPGDAYVDVIGVDAYLIGTSVSNGLTFARMSGGTTPRLVYQEDCLYGLRYLAEFARAHNKDMSIDEWGIGAERPDFIRDMWAFINDPKNRVILHGYWNKNAGSQVNGVYPFPCRLSDNSNAYPKSKAAYLYYFYGKGARDTFAAEQSATSALLARTTAVVTDTRRAAYDKLMAGIVSNGLINYLDALYLTAGQDSNIAALNVLGIGGFTTAAPRAVGRLSAVGSPIFTPDTGWKGDGTTGSYLQLVGHNPASSVNTKFTQDNAHMGAYFLTAVDNAGSQTCEAGSSSSFIGCLAGGGRWVGRPNTASTITLTSAGSGAGHVMWNRTGAAAWAGFFEGVQQQAGATASAPISNATLSLAGVLGVGGGMNQIAAFHYGKALPTGAPFNGPLLLRNLLNDFLHSIGAV